MAKVITYKCSQCGATVVVTKDLDTQLSPIYCCGDEALIVSEKDIANQEAKKTEGKSAKKKTAARKTVKKKNRPKKTKK